MGVDFIVESKTDCKWNQLQKETQNDYCKYAWRNIEWKTIFTLINFQISLLYGNDPNYWETSQLNGVLQNLKRLKNKDSRFTHDYDDENQSCANEREIDMLIPDIESLIKFFEEYVEKGCRIIVY